MEIRIERQISLLCRGRAPISGQGDRRYVLQGKKGLPDVRLWPGVKIVRRISIGENVLEIVCGVQESEDGPLFTCCAADAGDLFAFSSLQTVATSTTAAVRKLLEQLRVELGGNVESTSEKNVKGPHSAGREKERRG